MFNRFILSACLLVFVYSALFSQTLDKSLIDSVSIDSLINTVKDLSGEQRVNRYGINDVISKRQYNTTGNWLTENYLYNMGRELGYKTSKQTSESTCNNIILETDGTLYPDSVVIIGAHFDSYNFDDYNGQTNILSPGANDNASGCAVIVEIARLLRNYKPLYKMKFIFWDEEEVGLYGSEYYSRNAKINMEKIKLYINLDMIGWDKDIEGKIRIRFPYINKSSIYANSAKKICLDYIPGLNPVIETNDLEYMYFSDSYYFWKYGYSAIALSDVHGYNDFTHTQNDLFNLFNFDYFLNNTKLALALIMNFVYDYKPNNVDDNAGISDIMTIFPNPASDYLIISGFNGEGEIINALGSSLWHGTIQSGQRIDVSNLVNGIYFLKTKKSIQKFMVLR